MQTWATFGKRAAAKPCIPKRAPPEGDALLCLLRAGYAGMATIAMERMTMQATEIAMTILSANLTQVPYSMRDRARPPMIAPEVGVIRFTTPHAAEKTMIMIAGLKPSLAARGPRMGMDSVARPEVDGMRKDSRKRSRNEPMVNTTAGVPLRAFAEFARTRFATVSYTHLTLPTICSV